MKSRCLVTIGFLFLVSSVCCGQSKSTQLVHDLLMQGLVTNDDQVRFERVVTSLTKGTQFSERWHLNQEPKIDYLNLFVLKPGLRGQPNLPLGLTDYFGNCSYSGEDNIVLCDGSFLNSFLVRRDIRKYLGGTDRDQSWERCQDSFLMWVLGHELGHVLNGDKRAHFGEDAFETSVASTSIDQDREVKADLFLVHHILTDSSQCLNLAVTLIDILNAEIRSKVGSDLPQGAGILFDYTNKKVVHYMSLRRHPEFVVRITRMLQEIGKSKGYEGMKNMTDAFAKHMREG